MKKWCTRLISCLLACLMLIALVPFSAAAAQDEHTRETISEQADSALQEMHSHEECGNDACLNGQPMKHKGVSADDLLSESPDGGDQVDADARYTVALSSRLRSGETAVMRLKGGGEYESGAEATVYAYPKKGFTFVGWYKEADTEYAERLSSEQVYTFAVSGDLSLIALYDTSTESVFEVAVTGSRFKFNNSITQANSARLSFNAGERVFVSFTDTSMKFLYWENASRHIVSTDRDSSAVYSI